MHNKHLVERGLNSTIKFSLRMTGADPVSAESSARVLTEGFKIYASGFGSSLASKFTAAGIRNTVAAKKDMLFGWLAKSRRPITFGVEKNEVQAVFKAGKDVEHFNKHSRKIMKHFGLKEYSLEEYILDANHVINKGTFVPELNGYIQLPVGRGDAKSAFVGVDRITGEITTFHIKYIDGVIKDAPSLKWELVQPKVDLIGPNEHLGWKAPYNMKGPKL